MRGEYGAVGLACMVIIVTWVWKLLNQVWFEPKKLEKQLRKQGLQGSSYKFLFGDMRDVARMRDEAREKPIPFTNECFARVLPHQNHLVKTYGKRFFWWQGPVPVISITEAELIKEVFTRFNDFQKQKFNAIIQLLAPGIVTQEGENWAMRRKLLNPAFHLEKLKLMLPAMSASIIGTIDKWEDLIKARGCCEVDVCPYFTSLTADVISRTAFGSSYEEGRKIFELLQEQSQLTLLLTSTSGIPGWKYVPTKTNKRIKYVSAEIERLVKGIIDMREKRLVEGEAFRDDLLGILMDSNANSLQLPLVLPNRAILMDSNTRESKSYGSDEKKQLAMSYKDIIDECKLFYLAGQENPSASLTWTMILLGKHQDWQTRAREEVLATFGKNEPDYDGLNHLKIVTMIFYEVLRLYTPSVSLTRRVNKQEVLGDGLIVPKGAMVDLQLLQVHHDPKVWGDDVNEFNPNRFSQGLLKATKENASFFAFGAGSRICIGQNFVTIEAKMALSMILQRFSFELSPSYLHGPSSVISLQPQYGAQIILRPL